MEGERRREGSAAVREEKVSAAMLGNTASHYALLHLNKEIDVWPKPVGEREEVAEVRRGI